MVRKKEEQKVKLIDYGERSNMQDEFINEIQKRVADDNLSILAEEYRGRRGCRKIEGRLIQTFICDDPVAKMKVKGLGTYRAKIGDIAVAMDKEKEPCPMVEVWVYRSEGIDLEDSKQEPEVYYYSAWGWTLMDAIDSIGAKMWEALDAVVRKDYMALPEEMRG